jgi:hypothetical protein
MRVEVAGAEAPKLDRCMAAATRARKLRQRDEAGDVVDVGLSSGWRVVAVDEDDGRWSASEARSMEAGGG